MLLWIFYEGALGGSHILGGAVLGEPDEEQRGDKVQVSSPLSLHLLSLLDTICTL